MFRRSCGLSAGKYPVPNLDLNYAATGALSGIETFTRASSAWAFDGSGVLKQYPANTPRFDYGAVGREARGLLIEEQRTNIGINSNTFSSWTQSAGPISTPASGTAPTGVNEAWSISGVSASSRISRGTAIAADTSTYQFSVYLKQGTAAISKLRTACVGGNDATAAIVWATKTISADSGTHAAAPIFTSVGNGWYRATVSVTNTSMTSITTYIYPATSSTGSADTVLAFGAQLEAGSFATSYIPTTSAAVTRAADVCIIPTSAISDFSVTEGTMLVDFLRTVSTNTTQGRVASFSNGTNNNLIELYEVGVAHSYGQVIDSGAMQAQFITATGAANVAQRAALAWRTNDFGFSVAGSVQADASGTIPGVNSLRIGDRWDGIRNLNGYVRRVAIYSGRLDNSILARITS